MQAFRRGRDNRETGPLHRPIRGGGSPLPWAWEPPPRNGHTRTGAFKGPDYGNGSFRSPT